MDTAQNHALDAIEIIESILRGLGDRAQKRLARILAQHTQQLPQRESDHLAALALQVLHIGAISGAALRIVVPPDGIAAL